MVTNFRLYRILGILSIFVLSSCTEVEETTDTESADTVTFLQINDLHAHLTPHLDRVSIIDDDGTRSSKVVERGGLARLATLIKTVRSETPNTLVMNIGDTYHGGAEALFSYGNAIVDPVNALGIDVGVPGNWDFAYGPGVTWRRYLDVSERLLSLISSDMTADEIKKPNFQNLAANVSFTLPPSRAGEPMLPPTMMQEMGNVKVGIIGITSDIVPMMHEVLATGLDFLQGEENYKNLINLHAENLREQGANIVIVMSELGIQKDVQLAQIINPGVDVFFSAHTHEVTQEPLTSDSGAVVVEAGNDGYLGRMDISVADGKVVDIEWELITIDADIAEDAEVAQLVTLARAPYVGDDVNVLIESPAGNITLNRSIESVVGFTDEPLDRRNALESSFNTLYANLLKQAAGTQLAVTPGFRYDSVLLPYGAPLEEDSYANGEVTLEDVYRFFPVSYSLVTGETNGTHLKSIMENNLSRVFSTNAFQQGGGWFDGFSGVTIELDLAQPDGQRINSLYHSGTNIEIGAGETVTLAGCQRPFDDDNVICSYPGFTNVQPLLDSVTGVAMTPQALMIKSLSNGHLSGGSNTEINDANLTPQWPVAEYVQPLTGVQ